MTTLQGAPVVRYSIRSPLLWQTLLLAGLNLPVLLNYFSAPVAAAYVVGLLVVVFVLCRLGSRTADCILFCLLVGSAALQLALLFIVAPSYDGRMDRDDALVLWWERVWQGIFPYEEPTSIGNPISILPSLPIVALPFIILGNVGFLGIAAFGVLAALLWRYYRNAREQRIASLVALATAPVLLLEIAGRSDLIVNTTLLCLGVLVLRRLPWHRRSSAWIGGLILGIMAATRFAIWPTLIPISGFLLARANGRLFLFTMTIAVVVASVLILPFAAWDQTTFFSYAPLGVNATKLGADQVVQGFWLMATVVVALLATVWAYRAQRLFGAITVTLAVVVLGTWTTFFYDVSYVQFVFVPALFLAGESLWSYE